MSSCFSKLPKQNNLFFTIGPPTNPPVSLVVNVPGLNGGRPPRCRRTTDCGTGVDRSDERIRAAARDRVDAGADEVALPHVVGRNADLDLFDRLRAKSARRRYGRRAVRPDRTSY